MSATYNRSGVTFFQGGSYKFSGCPSLESLNFYAANITGQWPVFNNPALKKIDVRYTQISGGGGETDTQAAYSPSS